MTPSEREELAKWCAVFEHAASEGKPVRVGPPALRLITAALREPVVECVCATNCRGACPIHGEPAFRRSGGQPQPATPLAEPAPEELTMERLDPATPLAGPAPTSSRMERLLLNQRIVNLRHERDALRAEVERLKRAVEYANEAKRAANAGRPLGPVVGAQTIIEQQHEIQRLKTEIEQMRPVVEAAEAVRDGCECSPMSGCKLATLRGALVAYRSAKEKP